MQEQTYNQSNDIEKVNGTKECIEGVAETLENSLNDSNQLNNKAQIENLSNSKKENQQDIVDDDKNSFGKFKNKEELLKAYKSLEAEFTKKSQKLADFENSSNKEKVKVYESNDWDAMVENFAEKNPLAKEFAKQIGEQLIADENLGYNEHCLEIALGRVLKNQYQTHKDLATNQDFLDKYIYSSGQVKNKIISEYLSKVKNDLPPFTIGEGGNFTLTPPKKPKTINDCTKLVENLLK